MVGRCDLAYQNEVENTLWSPVLDMSCGLAGQCHAGKVSGGTVRVVESRIQPLPLFVKLTSNIRTPQVVLDEGYLRAYSVRPLQHIDHRLKRRGTVVLVY